LTWKIEFTAAAEHGLGKLDKVSAKRVYKFLHERLAELPDPRVLGRALKGQKYHDNWRYRVGDYRVIAEIKDDVVTILVVGVGHRREVYR
jgi:mRNA interferase RelE/StbE